MRAAPPSRAAPAGRFRRRRKSTRIRSWNGIRSSSTRSSRRTRRIRRVRASAPSSTRPSSMPTTGSSAATRRSSSRTSTPTARASSLTERRGGQRSSLPRTRRWWACSPLGRPSWARATRLHWRRSATTAATAGSRSSAASPGARRSLRPSSPGGRRMASTPAIRPSPAEPCSASGVRSRPRRR